jgi:hypothetical protein
MPFLRPGTATQEPAAMELPRKVAIAGGVAVAAAAATVAADRAVFVVDDAMLQAVDTLKIYVGKHAFETLFFDREVALILPHSPYQNPHQSGKQHTHTHTRAHTLQHIFAYTSDHKREWRCKPETIASFDCGSRSASRSTNDSVVSHDHLGLK